MTQARRIRQKPVKKPKRKPGKLLNLPWGLVLVILLSAAVIGLLFNGANTGDSRFGAGLKQLLEKFQESAGSDQEITDLIENKSSEKDFQFYELLPDIEKVMPEDLPEATPTRPVENLDYFLQAASFREFADAEKLRARLALRGFKSVTQAREVAGKGTYYRVRLGPYEDKRKAKTARNQLQKAGVHPFIYTVQK